MEIRRGKPFARGVSQLMYVGDDDAVEKATAKPTTTEVGAGVLAAILAAKSKGITRLVSAGIASVVAYRLYKAKQT